MTQFVSNHAPFSAEASSAAGRPRVAYVLKRYPRFSETFVVNEILAHEAAGWDLEIFSLRPLADAHFQHSIADVRAPVTYVRHANLRAEAMWDEIVALDKQTGAACRALSQAEGYDALEAYQGLAVARVALARGVTHLHAHFATSAAAVARLASLTTGIPYSVTAHAKDIFHEDNDERLLARKFADAAAVVTVSDFNLRDLRRRFPDAAGKFRRIYNGLDVQQFRFQEPLERAPRIVAVGRLVEKKGFDDLIGACRLLVDRGVSFTCDLIGGGEREAELRAQIAQLQLADRVTMHGPLPLREAHRRLSQAAVCAAPCVTARSGDRDGLPTVLLEAMALGAPCVATEVTGVTELVQNETTGLTVPERRIDLLADALERMLGDGQLRVRLARAARQLVEREFDIRRNAAELRRLFAHRDVPELAFCESDFHLGESAECA